LRCEASVPLLVAHHSAKKCLDSFGDEVSLFLQGKVPCIEQVKLSFWQIALISLCPFYGEERIVLSPQNQGRRLSGTVQEHDCGSIPVPGFAVKHLVAIDVGEIVGSHARLLSVHV
jgi:hypothetical protein